MTDEPGSKAFPALAETFAYLKEKDPHHPAYTNLMPNWARPEHTGLPTYEQYVGQPYPMFRIPTSKEELRDQMLAIEAGRCEVALIAFASRQRTKRERSRAHNMGGSSYMWDWKHNSFHHTYTNIAGHDDDINVGPLGRLSPHQKWHRFHRLQHIYLWLLYGLLQGMDWPTTGRVARPNRERTHIVLPFPKRHGGPEWPA